MEEKVYVALIISYEPIDTDQIRTAAGKEPRHVIIQSLDRELVSNRRYVTGSPDPNDFNGPPQEIMGVNDTCLSLSVLDWLRQLLGSPFYKPLYRRRWDSSSR